MKYFYYTYKSYTSNLKSGGEGKGVAAINGSVFPFSKVLNNISNDIAIPIDKIIITFFGEISKEDFFELQDLINKGKY